MASNRNATIWIPLALGISGVLMGLVLAKTWAELPGWASAIGGGIAVVFVAWAVYLAFRDEQPDRLRGGEGGSAVALGEDSRAIGGRGGDAGRGAGGDGGAATTKGRRSIAKGGKGGQG